MVPEERRAEGSQPEGFSVDNPYAAPTSDTLALPGDLEQRTYGGIGRLAFFGVSFLLSFVNNLASRAILGAGISEAGFWALVALSIGLGLVPIVLRLKNIGYSPWWCLLAFIPLINLLLLIRCIVCPEGYADHKKLDTIGKILTAIAIILFLAFVALLTTAFLSVR